MLRLNWRTLHNQELLKVIMRWAFALLRETRNALEMLVWNLLQNDYIN
jgi:hypothetical protein